MLTASVVGRPNEPLLTRLGAIDIDTDGDGLTGKR